MKLTRRQFYTHGWRRFAIRPYAHLCRFPILRYLVVWLTRLIFIGFDGCSRNQPRSSDGASMCVYRCRIDVFSLPALRYAKKWWFCFPEVQQNNNNNIGSFQFSDTEILLALIFTIANPTFLSLGPLSFFRVYGFRRVLWQSVLLKSVSTTASVHHLAVK